MAANHLVSVGLEGNAGRVAEMPKFSKMVYTSSWYFCHSEGWRVRNEALMSRVLKMVANARSHWIRACDANMDLTEFANGDWVNRSKAKVKAPPQGSATFCAKSTREVESRKRWTTWWSANRSMVKLRRLMRSTSILRHHIKVVSCTIKKG